MSLSLVPKSKNNAAPRGWRPGRELLREFLAAELAPGLSIEKACYPSVALFEGLYTPTPHEQSLGRRLLYQAGLLYLEHDPFEPGHVIIEHPLKFAERFPELKHVIPFLLHAKGVWVLSDAAPVEQTRPTLVALAT